MKKKVDWKHNTNEPKTQPLHIRIITYKSYNLEEKDIR